MFGSLSRRHLLVLSSGAALSTLTSVCSPSAVSHLQPLANPSPAKADPQSPPQTKSATPTRSITYAEPLPASALDGRGPAHLPDQFFERSRNFSNGTLSHRAVNVPPPTPPCPPEAKEGWQILEDPQSSPSATATPAATAEPSANIPSAHPTPNESTSSKAGRYIRGSA